MWRAAALFDRLPRVPYAAIQRAAAVVSRHRGEPVLSHTMHVWALQQARRCEEEARYSRAARLVRLRAEAI